MENWIWHQKYWDSDEPVETTGFLNNISVNEKEKEPIFKSSFNGEPLFVKEEKEITKIGFKY